MVARSWGIFRPERGWVVPTQEGAKAQVPGSSHSAQRTDWVTFTVSSRALLQNRGLDPHSSLQRPNTLGRQWQLTSSGWALFLKKSKCWSVLIYIRKWGGCGSISGDRLKREFKHWIDWINCPKITHLDGKNGSGGGIMMYLILWGFFSLPSVEIGNCEQDDIYDRK